MNRSKLQNSTLFILSLGIIAFELDIMRVFSVGSWSNFGSMVISIALLGYGIAGTLLSFIQEKVKKNPDEWLSWTAFALTPAMALSYTLAQYVPFNPIFMISQKIQFFWIGLYYIIYAIPFFVGAMFIGVTFIIVSQRVHKLYFWNMAGSGLGGIVLLILMYLMPVKYLIYVILLITSAGTVFIQFTRESNGGAPVFSRKKLIALALTAVLSLFVIFLFGDISISQYKATEQQKLISSDLEEKHYSFSPLGEQTVYASSNFHFAPGLSLNASVNISEMPENAFWGLYTDGNGPISIMRKLEGGENKYIDYLPTTSAYKIMEDPNVLLIRLGGGFSAFTALYNNAEKITIVEPNAALIDIIKNNPEVKEFNKGLLNNPVINVVQNEPRAFCASTVEKFDLVEISLIDSVGLSQSVGNSISENYIYTTEAIQDYMKSLDENGILSITTWNHLAPPRNVPKLLTTVYDALEKSGVENPEKKVFVFHVMYQTATILIKNSDFTPEEISTLNKFCYRMSFKEIYYPGIEIDSSSFDAIFDGYAQKYGTATATESPDGIGGGISLQLFDFYQLTMKHLIDGKADELFNRYIFDISPSTDDKPYYTVYMKPAKIPMFLDKLSSVSEEWSYLLVVGTLIQALIFGLLIILIPLIGNKRKMKKRGKKKLGVIVYYSFLGIGYMLIEIYLIQKLVFFLSDPTFSISLVITTMLIVSGLGSLYSNRFKTNPVKDIRVMIGVLIGILLLYMFALPAALNALLGIPLVLKFLLAVIFIAPAAFFMGMPFPTGLSFLSQNRKSLLPWAWGMNGALSVTGTLLAKVISIHWGFFYVLLIAISVYALAALVFPVNMIHTKE